MCHPLDFEHSLHDMTFIKVGAKVKYFQPTESGEDDIHVATIKKIHLDTQLLGRLYKAVETPTGKSFIQKDNFQKTIDYLLKKEQVLFHIVTLNGRQIYAPILSIDMDQNGKLVKYDKENLMSLICITPKLSAGCSCKKRK
jgi:hypothetical protein